MIKKAASLLSIMTLVFVAACTSVPKDGPPKASQTQINALTQAIQALGPHVDAAEAARAARIAYDFPLQLAKQYQITDAPLIHNIKVNRGTRPRGLCWHWAQDMETKLAQEQFQTLDLHRAIGNSEVALRIDHSTVILSAKGGQMNDGLVLDPWRHGGRLFWGKPLDDTKYEWISRTEVFALKSARARN